MTDNLKSAVLQRLCGQAPGSERIERMEHRVRELLARASAQERPHERTDAAARLARLARHNNVAGLARAHPDHWVRNPYLWQLVEAGALAGIDGDAAAAEAEKPNAGS